MASRFPLQYEISNSSDVIVSPRFEFVDLVEKFLHEEVGLPVEGLLGPFGGDPPLDGLPNLWTEKLPDGHSHRKEPVLGLVRRESLALDPVRDGLVGDAEPRGEFLLFADAEPFALPGEKILDIQSVHTRKYSNIYKKSL
jgi:hypothetical protein